MLRLTTRYADGWNLAWFGADSGRFTRKQEQLRAACSEIGRPPDQLATSAGVNVIPLADANDQPEALARLRQTNTRLADASDEQIHARYMIGDAGAIEQRLRPYSDAGTSVAICLVPGLSDSGEGAEMLQVIGGCVLPRVRRRPTA
jgi:alkanesulfonate monooxygenase SsuD/methylene tetrahydromethanopterin reductase-like flavin-dependent oxidoreductase (luciferase family)